MNESILIFGYGSLMNPKSLALTLPGTRAVIPATLRDYRRVCNVPVNGFAYLNLERKNDSVIDGLVLSISASELETLKVRERGYKMIDITDGVSSAPGSVYAFIATENCNEEMPVPRSYLKTCFAGLSSLEEERLLDEIRMPGGIYEDLENPVYANYVQD